MSHQWRPTDPAAEAALEQADLMPSFPSREEAEQWLALYWEDLLEVGVAEVALWEGEDQVIPPMSLEP